MTLGMDLSVIRHLRDVANACEMQVSNAEYASKADIGFSCLKFSDAGGSASCNFQVKCPHFFMVQSLLEVLHISVIK